MLLKEEREQVRAYGVKMLEKQLTSGTSGNISVLNREKGLYAISPTSMDYHEIRCEDVVVLDLEGHIVDGTRKPSVEHVMHRAYYRGRSDVNAVVHTHSSYATAVSCLGKPLPAVHFLIMLSGAFEVPCARFAPPGTEELAKVAFETTKELNAVLLQNHGLIALGDSIEKAMFVAEEMEEVSKLYCLSSCIGTPIIITPADMKGNKEA